MRFIYWTFDWKEWLVGINWLVCKAGKYGREKHIYVDIRPLPFICLYFEIKKDDHEETFID